MGLSPAEIRPLDMEARKRIAKRMSPAKLWERWGYSVIRASENELRVLDPESGDCVYRSARNASGEWISGMRDPGPIARGVGDNISLWQHFEPERQKRTGERRATDFRTSLVMILSLCDSGDAKREAMRPDSHESFPSLPLPSKTARLNGLGYLRKRGISEECARIFEEQGVLRFCGRIDPALFFVGRDPEGRTAFVARRSLVDGAAAKTNLSGTNMAMLPVFRGSQTTVFVEGGVNMLSVAELAMRVSADIPTIVMTGGQGNLRFSRNEALRKLLRGSSRIIFMEENDFHLSREAREAGLERKREQMRAASEMAGFAVESCPLDPAYNDINDILCDFCEMEDEIQEMASFIFGGRPSEEPC